MLLQTSQEPLAAAHLRGPHPCCVTVMCLVQELTVVHASPLIPQPGHLLAVNLCTSKFQREAKLAVQGIALVICAVQKGQCEAEWKPVSLLCGAALWGFVPQVGFFCWLRRSGEACVVVTAIAVLTTVCVFLFLFPAFSQQKGPRLTYSTYHNPTG